MNRTYSEAFNNGKAAPNFPYIWDANVLATGKDGLTTGAWRMYSTNDISNNNISVSGLNLTVGAVAITGTPPVQISNFPAITPISGIVTINSLPTHNVAVTGNPQVSISNTAPINVTGIINTVVTGTLGGNVTVNSVAITGAPVVTITGIVATSASVTVGNVAVTGGFINVNNTAPIPISGVVNATVSVGNTAITGFNSTIAPLAITGFVRTITTGSFSATVDNTSLILAVASGNAYSAAISGALLSGSSDAAYVTGQVSITNTAPLAISGVVLTVVTGSVSSSITNPIGVTGTKRDINSIYSGTSIYNFLAAGGRAVSSTGAGAVSGYGTGDYAIFNIDKSNGGLFVSQGCLESKYDAVTTVPSGLESAIYTSPSGTSPFTNMVGITGTALNANPNRLTLFVQNIHTGLPLYVLLGAGTPGTGNFSTILNPASSIGFGGNSFTTDRYKGQVNVSGGAWNAWEI